MLGVLCFLRLPPVVNVVCSPSVALSVVTCAALHDLFDQKKIAFVYHPLKQELICKVLATGAEDKSIELQGHCGDQPPVTVGQCDGLTLTVGHGDDDEPLWPFRRLLSVHASIAFSKSDLPDDAKQEFRDFLNVSDGALRPDNIDWPYMRC